MTTPTDLSRLATTLSPIAQQLAALAALENATGDSARDAIDTAHIDLLHQLLAAVLDQYGGSVEQACWAVTNTAANIAARAN